MRSRKPRIDATPAPAPRPCPCPTVRGGLLLPPDGIEEPPVVQCPVPIPIDDPHGPLHLLVRKPERRRTQSPSVHESVLAYMYGPARMIPAADVRPGPTSSHRPWTSLRSGQPSGLSHVARVLDGRLHRRGAPARTWMWRALQLRLGLHAPPVLHIKADFAILAGKVR
jgi:hypothetical protein